jgi:ATP-dependent helicase/nuclease subunit B
MILTKSKRKSIDIDLEIDAKIKAEKHEELLLIVPTNRKIRSLKKEIISSSPNKTSGKINIETIGTFATKILFKDDSAGNKVLSEAASAVLLKQGFHESNLKYFSHYKEDIPAGTLERVKNVISEYKKQGITPGKLLNEAETLTGSEKLKAEDIAAIYKVYQEKCNTFNVKEIGDIYNELVTFNHAKFEEHFRELYPSVDLIIINGFDEFSNPEIEIINSASLLSKVNLFISFDYYIYNPLMFSHLDKCYEKLKSKGFDAIGDVSKDFHNPFQKAAREKLFNNSSKKVIKDYESAVIKLTAKNREKEIEVIAKEIKELITSKKVEPHEICVVFNLIQKYSPFIRDIFNLYGIPFNLTDRFSLSESSPVIAIINFLEILENDFYYKNIFRALSGGYLSSLKIDTDNLLKASIDLKIISGYENWKTALSDALKRQSYEDEDGKELLEKKIFEGALHDIELLYENLSAFDKKMKIEEFVKNFEELIFKLNLPLKLIMPYSGAGNSLNSDDKKAFEPLEENVKALTTFIEETTELFNLLKLEYKDEKFPLRFFLNNIRTAVGSSRYNIKEKPGFGVQVTTLNEIRGLKFKYFLIAGLCDGDFPTSYTPEIFFSGSFRRGELNHQTEERYRFYQSLCAWEKGLYLCFPLQEDRKDLVESNFLNEFEELFSLKNKNEQNYSDAVYSKTELLKSIGENINGSFVKNIKPEFGVDVDSIKNSVAVNSLRIEEPFGSSEYTGNIKEKLSEEAKKSLEDFKERQFSISQLETYAGCPYKYFAERVLALKPLEEPTEEIEAIEMGTILHEILFNFYKSLRSKGIVLQECGDEDFKKAEELMFAIAEEKISEANFNSALAFLEREKILGIEDERKNSILYKFLEEERKNSGGYIPEYFEIGFGKIDDENEDVNYVKNFKAGDVSVRGKIDRIDINNEDKTFKVVDYKLSGKKPSSNDLHEGLSLQLPLYMYAAKKLIEAQLQKDYDPSGAEIYSLKFDEEKFGRSLAKINSSRKKLSEEELLKLQVESGEEMIKICLDAVQNYVQKIVEGKFNLTTLKNRENKICKYCSFKPVCRIQEVD